MNILMMTNTYKPIVGGLERSLENFTKEYRKRGHKVLIVVPEFKNIPKNEKDVIRVAAIQHFNGTDFSVKLPISKRLSDSLKKFKPDIVHSHHPFLIGDTALRVASRCRIPIVFTFHTLYEHNTHYVSGGSKTLRRFVVALATGYANLCDSVFVPSQSIADLLHERGVKTSITVIPTGIYVENFAKGNKEKFRAKIKVPQDAFIVGFVGRIALEKNMYFLSKTVALFLKKKKNAYFLIVGKGPLVDDIKYFFRQEGLRDRLICIGILGGQDLVDAYQAMDVFAFASHTETQGLVLTEAMAAGIPVVAVDAPGVRDVVKDYANGRLLVSDEEKAFVSALQRFTELSTKEREIFKKMAQETAKNFSIDKSVDYALDVYTMAIKKGYMYRNTKDSPWMKAARMIKTEWDLIKNMSKATGVAINGIKK
ncbi:MAG: glycosyltransferase [Candidatus Omnitrophica bacterium]|nr:glycosyltransferase [Candidatus Omnitrophota bacterium]